MAATWGGLASGRLARGTTGPSPHACGVVTPRFSIPPRPGFFSPCVAGFVTREFPCRYTHKEMLKVAEAMIEAAQENE